MDARKTDKLLAELGGRQHGVFLATQAFELGITKQALAHRVGLGWLVRVARGLYRLRDRPWTWDAQAHAAVLLAGWGSVLSHGAAARAHGLWAYRDHETLEVSVAEGGNPRARLGRLHVTSWMPPEHLTEVDGIPVTTVARTCFDLAGDVPPALRSVVGREVHRRHVRRVMNDALRSRGLVLLHESAVLAALAGRGHSGTVMIRGLLDEFRPRYQPTDSDGEDLFLELVATFGLPRPEVHVVISDHEGFIAEVDFLYRPRLIVEIDGLTHAGPADIERDERRDERLRRAGYRVERVRYRPDLLLHADRVAGQLRGWLKQTN